MEHPKRIIAICSAVLLLILILLFACHNINSKKTTPAENNNPISNPTTTSTVTTTNYTTKTTTVSTTPTTETTILTTNPTITTTSQITTIVTTVKQTQPPATQAPKPTPTQPPQTEPPKASVSFNEDMYNNVLKPYAESIGYDFISVRKSNSNGYRLSASSSVAGYALAIWSAEQDSLSLAYWGIIDLNAPASNPSCTADKAFRNVDQVKAKLKEVAIQYGFYTGN
jgi:LAS superfamily LD-carboxypeptidase LdcB